tara:strand:- start:480 stop:878 length:399 start_codon:yes stop_codon:yes gene_type:complete
MFLIVPTEPVGKARPRFGRGKTYTPAKTVKAETFIQLCATQKGVPKLLENSLRMIITFSMGIPKSWSAKKKAEAKLGNIRPTSKPDIDNLIKLVGDALNGIAYKDDSQIVEIQAVKKYGKPQTIIHIEEVIK